MVQKSGKGLPHFIRDTGRMVISTIVIMRLCMKNVDLWSMGGIINLLAKEDFLYLFTKYSFYVCCMFGWVWVYYK